MTDLTSRPAARAIRQLPTLNDEIAAGTRLLLEGIARRYGSIVALSSVDLAVQQGELVALLGPSGCGKTTTLRLIAGFESPDSGTITIAGQQVANGATTVPPERRKVGMVFQEYALFPHLSVAENVGFGVMKSPNRAQLVGEALDLVGLNGLEERMPNQLSGGQQQRVALARALAPRPDLVLLDEPFSNLDPHLRSQVRDEVREILRTAGATAVLVTHDQEEALTLADRVAVMFDGRIVQCDAPEATYHRPVNRQVARFIGDAQFLPGSASGEFVSTELGSLPLARKIHGEVNVLIRPEMLDLGDDPARGGLPVSVIERRFVGRELLATVEAESGARLVVRALNDAPWVVGDDLFVSVKGTVIAFHR